MSSPTQSFLDDFENVGAKHEKMIMWIAGIIIVGIIAYLLYRLLKNKSVKKNRNGGQMSDSGAVTMAPAPKKQVAFVDNAAPAPPQQASVGNIGADSDVNVNEFALNSRESTISGLEDMNSVSALQLGKGPANYGLTSTALNDPNLFSFFNPDATGADVSGDFVNETDERNVGPAADREEYDINLQMPPVSLTKQKLQDLHVRFGATRSLSDGMNGSQKNLGMRTDIRNLIQPIPVDRTSDLAIIDGAGDEYYSNPYTKKVGSGVIEGFGITNQITQSRGPSRY